MTDSPEQPSDEELSELIDDEEKIVDDETEQNEGGVEVGIPPAINDEEGVDSTEESFSMDDFESTDVVENPIEETVAPEAAEDSVSEESTVSYEEKVESQESDQNEEQVPETNGAGGGVSEFRKTLSNLSRQLEIDRLAFLHQSMKDRGEEVPSLSQIAADIKGTKPLSPKGDNDEYGSRPSARLDGWVSGLSFGVSRRAKKFSK